MIQFRSAYKRLLVRHEISGSIYGNCTILDSADTENILFVSANKRIDADAICNNDMNDTNDQKINRFYLRNLNMTMNIEFQS